ncbi:hypothetical protein GY50_0610 [Dehalococcoides mccartyi GY50]|nr:hypothetical protein GY50_0610 [Dehalococcoides mccartyi GY50]
MQVKLKANQECIQACRSNNIMKPALNSNLPESVFIRCCPAG